MPSRHPLTTRLRSYAARLTERADADAGAAGLTVEVLRRGVRRYRDPRLDQLAGYGASQLPVTPPAAVGTEWSQPRLVVVAELSRCPQGPPPVPVCLDYAAVVRVDDATGALVDQSGEPVCGASYGAHAPDVPVLPAGPTASANRIPDRRTERGGPRQPGGTGAVPAPTVPRQGRSASSASLRDRLRRPWTRDTQQRR
jgi:hypothetical protein